MIKRKLVEFNWLPDWAYSEPEFLDIKNRCVYFTDEVYALYVNITETYYYRVNPNIKLGFDSIELI